MKKSVYLKLSQQEANKKLQLSLFERYNRIKQKSCLLGYLYFPFAYIAFSFIAIVSFGYRVVMLFQDIRFTPHYMKTVIEYNDMNILQANEYLDSQLLEYKKRLSYGNISIKEKNSIDTTFSLLYDEYKLPEPEDKKYLEVISNLSDMKNISSEGFCDVKQAIIESRSVTQESASILSSLITEKNEFVSNQQTDIQQSIENNIGTSKKILESVNSLSEQGSIIKNRITRVNKSVDDTYLVITDSTDKINKLSSQLADNNSDTEKQLSSINSTVKDIKSTIKPIALYTEQKQLEEKVETKRINELRESQKKRETTAYNREKGKRLNSFESTLTDKQITILVNYCNKISVFDRDIEFREMKDILLCVHQKPLRLTVNRYLSALFSELYDEGLICKTWKSVASRHKCFISAKGKELTVNDFYMANQTSVFMDEKKSNLIKECIEKISSVLD